MRFGCDKRLCPGLEPEAGSPKPSVNALLQQIRRTMQRHALCPPGSRVLVGVSGGSDSVALAARAPGAGAHPATSRSLGSHTSTTASGRPPRATRQFCRDLAALAGRRDSSTERPTSPPTPPPKACRSRTPPVACATPFSTARRHALAATRIAVGHTMDDQAETVLLKLMRGAGPAGLGGVYPRKGKVIRPLLGVSREELRAWLTLARPALGRGRNATRI